MYCWILSLDTVSITHNVKNALISHLVRYVGSGAPNLFVFHDMMLNARLDREAKAQVSNYIA